MKQAAAEKEIVTKPGSEISVVDLDINSKKIAELRQRYASLDADLKDDDNYRKTQDVINEAREMRGKIKVKGKGLKDDALAWQKKVVAEEKRLDGEIIDFLEPLAARKKVHDDAVKAEKERLKKVEQARKDTHLANINGIRILISKAQNQPSAEIEKVIAELEAIAVEGFYSSFEEYEDEAESVYDDTDFALRKLLLDAQNVEEADRKRKEEDERLKKEREALAAQTAENERVKKENDREKADLEKEKAALAPVAQEEQQEADPEVTEEPAAQSIHASTKVHEKISNEKSVIEQAKDNGANGLKESITRYTDTLDCLDMFDQKECAAFVMSDIASMKIPGISYSML